MSHCDLLHPKGYQTKQINRASSASSVRPGVSWRRGGLLLELPMPGPRAEGSTPSNGTEIVLNTYYMYVDIRVVAAMRRAAASSAGYCQTVFLA